MATAAFFAVFAVLMIVSRIKSINDYVDNLSYRLIISPLKGSFRLVWYNYYKATKSKQNDENSYRGRGVWGTADGAGT